MSSWSPARSYIAMHRQQNIKFCLSLFGIWNRQLLKFCFVFSTVLQVLYGIGLLRFIMLVDFTWRSLKNFKLIYDMHIHTHNLKLHTIEYYMYFWGGKLKHIVNFVVRFFEWAQPRSELVQKWGWLWRRTFGKRSRPHGARGRRRWRECDRRGWGRR